MSKKSAFAAIVLTGVCAVISACSTDTDDYTNPYESQYQQQLEEIRNGDKTTTAAVSEKDIPAVTTTKAADATITAAAQTAAAQQSDVTALAQLVNVSTGEITPLYNAKGLYTQTDGYASFVIYACDIEGAEGWNVGIEAVIEGVCCDSGNKYSNRLNYKPPSFLIHFSTENGVTTIDDVNHYDRFGESYLTIGAIEPLVEAHYGLEIYFLGDDGNTYCFCGEAIAPFTEGDEPPEKIYDEMCGLCYGTGKCSVCDGTGWYSTAAEIRCSSCTGYNGVCIGCDGIGYH